jgi:hypothetical protein
VSLPDAQTPPQLLWAVHPSDQHPAGTPENSAPALKTSGYTAMRASVSIAPEDAPIAYTRCASAPRCETSYCTISAIACVSPPPLCVSEAFEPTSQQSAELAGLVVCGKIMMKPYWSAAASIAGMPVKPNIALALPPQ